MIYFDTYSTQIIKITLNRFTSLLKKQCTLLIEKNTTENIYIKIIVFITLIAF